MYRLIGTDGKTYGPVNLEQVRQWIVQGRADSRTAVFVDGTSDWTFLGLLPEFAGHFPVTPPLIAPVKTGSPTAVTFSCWIWANRSGSSISRTG